MLMFFTVVWDFLHVWTKTRWDVSLRDVHHIHLCPLLEESCLFWHHLILLIQTLKPWFALANTWQVEDTRGGKSIYMLWVTWISCRTAAACSVEALMPLMDSHCARGFRGQRSQRWHTTRVPSSLPRRVWRPPLQRARSHGNKWTYWERPHHSSCRVSIIQSDVWLICFPILITPAYK